MIFILKPKNTFHGKSLKRWYRRVYVALTGRMTIPERWDSRPGVRVPAEKLSSVMDTLYKGNFITNF